ncbi:winged helix-turn-helix domain-containing protein [Amaricoccus sp.]|uniref:winged helix-turn-helix domain-containing protein n=1 Tax=Amaricoccus sp. TaxID=1872485 RepID=UPI001B7AEE6D|nr:LysR family transcriptional regulator [Amaricoccus sp.]MBP7003728.1 LysR family transcriptional regulator [Amaricoccus sp.]
MGAISLRIDLVAGGRIGPGKVALLEHIASEGSISAGARRMAMSYRQAWLLVEDMNRTFGKPVVTASKGGRRGGGSALTPLGLAIVARYRAIERAAETAAAAHVAALREEIAGA